MRRGRGLSPPASMVLYGLRVRVRERLLLHVDPGALAALGGEVGLVERHERGGDVAVLVEADVTDDGGELVAGRDRVGPGRLADRGVVRRAAREGLGEALENHLRARVARRAVGARRLAELGRVIGDERRTRWEVVDARYGAVDVRRGLARHGDRRTLGAAGAEVGDAVRTHEGDLLEALDRARLLERQTHARRRRAGEVDGIGLQFGGRGEERGVVGRGLRGAVALDDLAAGALELLRERIAYTDAEGLGVVEDVDVLLAEVGEQEVGARRTLDRVRRGDADVVDLVGIVRTVLRRLRRVRQARVRVRGAALQQATGVADRDLRLGNVRVERPDDTDD